MPKHPAAPSQHADRIIQAVLKTLDNPHSKRAYERHMRAFLDEIGEHVISKAVVQEYAKRLQRRKLSASLINQKLSAIRALAQHAAKAGALEQHIANGVKAVPGLRAKSERTAKPLTKQQVSRLFAAVERTMPERSDHRRVKQFRDLAVLALHIGCGLWRSEIASLTYEQIRLWSGVMHLPDELKPLLLNLGSRREVMPDWVQVRLEDYRHAIKRGTGGPLPTKGIVFHPITKGGEVQRGEMTEQAISNIVAEYADAAGLESVTPTDLRQTFVKSAPKLGTPLR